MYNMICCFEEECSRFQAENRVAIFAKLSIESSKRLKILSGTLTLLLYVMPHNDISHIFKNNETEFLIECYAVSF